MRSFHYNHLIPLHAIWCNSLHPLGFGSTTLCGVCNPPPRDLTPKEYVGRGGVALSKNGSLADVRALRSCCFVLVGERPSPDEIERCVAVSGRGRGEMFDKKLPRSKNSLQVDRGAPAARTFPTRDSPRLQIFPGKKKRWHGDCRPLQP